MTVAEDLSNAAALPLSATESGHLRAATLTNIAAGLGDLGSSTSVIEAVRRELAGAPADDAAVFAMRLHARTQDDFVPAGRSHVGAVTLAAAVALADVVADRLLDCLAFGYRAMMAVARAYSAQAQQRRYRPTGFFGPFGASGVAAQAYGLDSAAAANTFGLVCATTAGTNQSWLAGTDEWLLEVGWAARAGLECAGLTRAGVRAAKDAFEGQAGWSTAFFGDVGAATLAASLRDPVDLSTLATKPYPVSGIAQPMTDLAVQAHHRLAGRTVRRVIVRISAEEADYPGSMNRGPFASRAQTLMSVAFCVASGLVDGQVKVGRLDAPAELAQLLDRIDVVVDPNVAELDAVLTVHTEDGEEITLEGTGRSLLFTSWDDIDPHEVARRSEAPTPGVLAAYEELGRPHPDARVLRDILAGRG